jgi:hypothetical protein
MPISPKRQFRLREDIPLRLNEELKMYPAGFTLNIFGSGPLLDAMIELASEGRVEEMPEDLVN